MEDVEIQMRLRKMGKFVKLQNPVVTSARRFVKSGVIRQQLRNTLLVFLFHLGFSPDLLSRHYE